MLKIKRTKNNNYDEKTAQERFMKAYKNTIWWTNNGGWRAPRDLFQLPLSK